jgi:hypothetical protein
MSHTLAQFELDFGLLLLALQICLDLPSVNTPAGLLLLLYSPYPSFGHQQGGDSEGGGALMPVL